MSYTELSHKVSEASDAYINATAFHGKPIISQHKQITSIFMSGDPFLMPLPIVETKAIARKTKSQLPKDLSH